MDMNNNAFKVNNRLHRLDVEVRKQKRKYEGSERNLNTAKWVTGILYFAAICTLYLADPRGMTSYLIENTSEWFAILVFGLASILLPIFLSRTKEDRYSHIAELVASPHRMSATDKAITTLTLSFFLSSGILFEVFTATSQQQHIANNTAEKSGAFKTVQGQQIVVQPDSAISTNLATAQRKLEQCQHKLKEGKTKHCDGDSALVNSLSASQAAGNAALAGASAAAINSQTENLLKITEESNKPVFKMIRDHFKVTINTGMVLAVAIMIFIFEVQHIINLFTYAGRLRRYRELAEEFDELRGELHQETGNDFTAAQEEVSPSKVSNLRKAWDELKHPAPAFSPATALTSAANTAAQTIATEYARADHANKQVLADGANTAANYIDKRDFLNRMYKDCRTRVLNGEVNPNAIAVSHAIDDFIIEFRKTTFDAPQFMISMDTVDMAEKALNKMAMERIIMKTNKGYVISSQFSDNRPTPSTIASTIKMIIDGVDINKAATPDDIKKAVYNTYSVIPNPAPLDDTDLDNVAKKIAQDRGLNQASPAVIEQAPTPTTRPIGFFFNGYPTTPRNQYIGGTGDHNPILGKAEAIYPMPLPVADLVDRNSLTDSNDLVDRNFADLNSLTGQRKSVSEVNAVNDGQRLEEMAKKLANAENELAEKSAKEAADLADRKAAEAIAQAKRTAEEEAQKRAVAAKEAADLADRIAAEKQAIVDRIAAEAKAAADLADRQAAVNAAAKEAADRIAAAEQEAADRAERGSLTDEQIAIAVNVIRNAVNEKHITTLGSPSTAPLLKAAGLPTSTDSLRALSKLACKQLTEEGLVILNPKPAKGQPIYVIA